MKTLLKLLLLLLIVKPAQSEEIKTYCAALENSKTYNKNESYRYLIAGGINKQWVFRSRKDLKEDFTLSSETIGQFLKLNNLIKQQGKTLHILMPPTRGIAHGEYVPPSPFVENFDQEKAINTYQKSLEDLRTAGLYIVDFSNTPQDILDNFYYKRDHHWSSIGANYSASKTVDLLKLFPADFKTKKFTTEITKETIGIKGSFEQFIERICNVTIQDQKVPIIHTYSKSDLFNDEDKPAIALVGTSNTTEPGPSYSNFAGYLREFLQADVDNLSIQGAGIFTPLAAYLASDEYKQNNHKHVIWELASHYDFNGKEFEPIFAQIVPAAAGPCSEKALHSSTHTLEAEKTNIYNGEIRSKNPYIYLKFLDNIKKDFAISIKFEDGKSKRFRFKREDRYPHDGIYFMDLQNNNHEIITQISLFTPKEFKNKSINFELCEY